MARDLAPTLKRSRREGVAMHPKAIKGLTKRGYGPGEHGKGGRRTKDSQYALQLREKQKVKRIYGLLEKQFRRIVAEAERQEGISGEVVLILLEQRMDNAVYRLGWAPSRQGARQLVSHGHILHNGRRVNVPSISLQPGDELEVREKSQKNPYFQKVVTDLKQSKLDSRWLSLESSKLSAKVTGHPVRDDIMEEISEQLIIEFYSR